MPQLNSAQLAFLRSQSQTSHWYCVPIAPVTVFAARINSAGIGVGAVTIPYDSVTVGAFGDVLQGMTLLVGSSAGLSDYGILRIRLNADATNLYVAWNSDIAWADNLYLTVQQQFLAWSVRQRIVPPVIYKDYNIAYTDQTEKWPPVALMGDNVCKLWAGNPTTVYFDGSGSYTVDPGATITGYAWDFGDGSSTTGVTPGLHSYTSAGTYYATLTVTDSNGKTHLTRRIIALPDPASVYTVKFEGTSLDGAVDDGWKAKVRVFDPLADTAHFPERAPCFIISADTYGGTSVQIGFPTGRVESVFFGYIVEDSVAIQPEYNEITFDLESIAGVMARADSPPVYLGDSNSPSGEPDAWAWGTDLNVFRGLVYLLKFHSTVMDIADVSLYNDTTLTKAVDYPADSLWNMLLQFAKGKRLMRASVTRTGRVVVGRDPNLVSISGRTAFTTVCTLQQGDWREQVTAPQRPYPITSFICISGLSYDGDPTHEPNPLFGMSPGRPPKDYGVEREIQYLKLVDQVECNTLAGLLLGTDNMPFGDIVIPMRGNWVKCFDPALQEYVQTPSGGWVTKRGTLLDSVKLIVRKVTVAYEWEAGVMQPTLTCDYYSFPEIGVNGDCFPPDAPPPPQPSIPPIIPPNPPPSTQPAPVITDATSACDGSDNPATTVTWTWGGAGTPTYYVEYSLLPTSGFVLFGTTSSLSIPVSGIVAGRTYYFRVRALVSGVYTTYSNVVSELTVYCTPTLSIGYSCATANLSWTAVGGSISWAVERSAVSGSGFVLIGGAPGGTLTFDDTPSTRGTWYYRVRAVNAYGAGSYSNEVSDRVGLSAWHEHLIVATALGVYEWSGATFGIGYSPAPTDITGNLAGTILAYQHRRDTGTDIILTDDTFIDESPGVNLGTTYVRSGAATWTETGEPAGLANSYSYYSHTAFAEDGTGPHGFAFWCGARIADGCTYDGTGTQTWTYLATDVFLTIIGTEVIILTSSGTVLTGCSTQTNGVSSFPMVDGTPTYNASPSCGTPAPTIVDQGYGILFGIGVPAHFSAYSDEDLHTYVLESHLIGNHLYEDGVDITTTTNNGAPAHFTDELGQVWRWGAFGTLTDELYKDGVLALNEPFSPGPFAVNVPPSSDVVRAVNGSNMFKSVDDGANWTTHPVFVNAVGIYTQEGEVDRLYGFDSDAALWLSDDDGAHWCKVWDGDGSTPLGVWVDTTT